MWFSESATLVDVKQYKIFLPMIPQSYEIEHSILLIFTVFSLFLVWVTLRELTLDCCHSAGIPNSGALFSFDIGICDTCRDNTDNYCRPIGICVFSRETLRVVWGAADSARMTILFGLLDCYSLWQIAQFCAGASWRVFNHCNCLYWGWIKTLVSIFSCIFPVCCSLSLNSLLSLFWLLLNDWCKLVTWIFSFEVNVCCVFR